MSLEVLKTGPLSLLQDYGRYGHQISGMGSGGPMDEHAYLWANYLLENSYNAACVEVTLGPLQLRATQDVQIAITGADMQASVAGQAVQPWSSCHLKSGQILDLRMARTGLRAYVAVRGGIQAEAHYGSCATVMREGIGGLHQNGKKLAVGDRIPCTPSGYAPVRSAPEEFIPNYADSLALRLLPSYQHDDFKVDQRTKFFAAKYTISTSADRMGYRLKGTAITGDIESMLSEGISYGAVQIPPDGQPIVLLRDRQTIGGYPKIGCVASLDASRLAQRRPGEQVSFLLADWDKVLRERSAFEHHFGVRNTK